MTRARLHLGPFSQQGVVCTLVLIAWTLLLTFANTAEAADYTVNLKGFAFDPHDLTVSVGDTVTWTNQDSVFHTTTSGTNGVPSGLWDSGFLSPGSTFSFTFNIPPGYYGYYCTPHVFSFNMFGSITVVAPNIPPSVTITNPIEGAIFTAGNDILVQADASDSDGTVVRVDFSANGNPIGSAANPPYNATFTSPAPGNYVLSAVAVDDRGASSTQSAVHVTIQPANLPPSISITNPTDGQVFNVGSNVVVEVDASDPDGSVSQVEFFLSDVSAGVVTNQPFSIVLTNPAIGNYALTAVATDDLGATSAAPAVAFSVVQPTIEPAIVTQPQSQSVLVGTPVTFSVSASGTPPLSYQWQFNGTGLDGATTSSLVLTNPQLSDSGNYTVTVSNSAGSVTSAPAVLTVTLPANQLPLVVISNPTNNTKILTGANLTVVADASDSDGTVRQVEFFVGASSIGISTNLGNNTNRTFSVVTNLPAGDYILTAHATDDRGGIGISSPVNIRVFIPELVPPTIAITRSLPNFARTNSATVYFAGTARDNIGLDHVEYQINGGPWFPAVGTTSWSLQTNLSAGGNVILFRSVDLATNVSIPVGRFLTYVVQVPLSVANSGTGTVVPDLNGQLLEIGRSYTLHAKPGPGQLFAGWNVAPTHGPDLSFVMQSNLVLVANFQTNLFPWVKGAYAGLFFDTNAVEPVTSGFLKLQLAKPGTFSGKLVMNGANYPLSGRFDPSGKIILPVLRRTLTPIVLTLNLDLSGGPGQITGSALSVVGSIQFRSDLLAVRNSFSARTNPALQAGQRAFVLQRTANDGGGVVGNGTAHISHDGSMTASGHLTDGRPFNLSSLLSPDGNAPFYLSFNAGSEVILGWTQFGVGAVPSVGGTLFWVKSTTDGFSRELVVGPSP